MFRITFDIPRGMIYFAKGHTFGKPPNKSAIGIGLLRKNEKTVVMAVQPGGPAEKAGLKAGDELISIGGEAVAGKPIEEIKWLMREKADAKRLLILSYRRGDEHQVTIKIND